MAIYLDSTVLNIFMSVIYVRKCIKKIKKLINYLQFITKKYIINLQKKLHKKKTYEFP